MKTLEILVAFSAIQVVADFLFARRMISGWRAKLFAGRIRKAYEAGHMQACLSWSMWGGLLDNLGFFRTAVVLVKLTVAKFRGE